MGIKSLEELRELRLTLKPKIDLREKGESTGDVIEILVGMATCGITAGARETFNQLLLEIEKQKLDNVKVISVGCIGSCSMEPTVQISMPNRETIIYGNITEDKVVNLIRKVIIESGYLPEDFIVKTFEKVEVYNEK